MISITEHGLNHPSLRTLITNADWQGIADWYAQSPTPNPEELMDWMSFRDRSRFYAQKEFQSWYSNFCLKLSLNQHLAPVLTLTDGSSLFPDYIIKAFAKSLAVGINKHRIMDRLLTIVVQDLFKRANSGAADTIMALQELLVCLISDEVLEPYTGLIYYVDMSIYPRWMTMRLAAPPTPEQCQSALAI